MTVGDEFDQSPADLVDFAHESERQFAKLLDFYDIVWEYEPREFAIEFDEVGAPTKFFRPDFYLPGEEQYIEITTMNQKLVTKKNRKVKQLRQQYPDIHCKIFYQRDYLNLVVKYELDDLADQELPVAPSRIPGPPQVIDLGGAETSDAAVS
ncbi:MAG: hypothetical protein ACR2JP_03820 [Acidimicrobiia bacterium]